MYLKGELWLILLTYCAAHWVRFWRRRSGHGHTGNQPQLVAFRTLRNQEVLGQFRSRYLSENGCLQPARPKGSDRFDRIDGRIVGRSAIGRVTDRLLNMNHHAGVPCPTWKANDRASLTIVQRRDGRGGVPASRVVAACADSSVQFYSNEFDPRAWIALGTRGAGD
jgi:hypothetical protein